MGALQISSLVLIAASAGVVSAAGSLRLLTRCGTSARRFGNSLPRHNVKYTSSVENALISS